jgi:hypothetical protein
MKKIVLLAAVITLFAAPVTAKEGPYIGAYLIPKSTVSVLGDESGEGIGFRAGLGFNRYLSMEGSFEQTDQDTADMTGLAVDVKVNFPLTSLDSRNVMSLEPYLRVGYGFYELDAPGDPSGDGVRIGIGIELYLFRELSVNAGWTSTDMDFDGADSRVRIYDIGVNYHFM